MWRFSMIAPRPAFAADSSDAPTESESPATATRNLPEQMVRAMMIFTLAALIMASSTV
jgi:hypothetical protein